MNITLNGDAQQLNDGICLNQLIEQLNIKGRRIAVEINQQIIPKSEHLAYEIKDGDRIEIVHAIGGG